jgi:CheY-like chemotaxis protein
MSDSNLEKILIIDDNSDYRKLIKTFIKKLLPGVETIEHDPVFEGVPDDSFNWSEIDVLLLDYNLSIVGTTGLDILHRHHKKASFPATIMLTGAGTEEIAIRALKSGIYEYQAKQSLTKDHLKQSIIHAWEDKKSERRKKQEITQHNRSFSKEIFYENLEKAFGHTEIERALVVIKPDDIDKLEEKIGIIGRDSLVNYIAKNSFDVFKLGACNPNITRISDTEIGIQIDYPINQETLDFNMQGLCKHLAKCTFKFSEEKYKFSVSIGVLKLGIFNESAEKLIHIASTACIQASKTKGNSHYVWKETDIIPEFSEKKRINNEQSTKNDIEQKAIEEKENLETELKAAEQAKEKAEAAIQAEQEAKKKLEAELKVAAEAKEKAEAELKIAAEEKEKAVAREKMLAEKAQKNAAAELKIQEETKTQAEQKARENAELEAKNKAQAEQEVQHRIEAELKAKAETKAKVDAELRAEQEARHRIEAELKAKAETKAKVDAELRAEQEARHRIEAELKTEEEAKAKVQAEAEMKAAKEEKEKLEAELKAVAEAKAQAEAEMKAAKEEKEKLEIKLKAITEANVQTLKEIKTHDPNPITKNDKINNHLEISENDVGKRQEETKTSSDNKTQVNDSKDIETPEISINDVEAKIKKLIDEKRIIQTYQPVTAMFGDEDAIKEIYKTGLQAIVEDDKLNEYLLDTSIFSIDLQQIINEWVLRQVFLRITESGTTKCEYLFLISVTESWFSDITLFNWLQKILSQTKKYNPGKSIILNVPLDVFNKHKKRAQALLGSLHKSHQFSIALSNIHTLDDISNNCVLSSSSLLIMNIEQLQKLKGILAPHCKEEEEKDKDKDKEEDENREEIKKQNMLQYLKSKEIRIITSGIEDSTLLTDAITAGTDYTFGSFVGEIQENLVESSTVESFELT